MINTKSCFVTGLSKESIKGSKEHRGDNWRVIFRKSMTGYKGSFINDSMSLWAWQSLFRMKSKKWNLWGIRVETFSTPYLHQWPGEGNEQLNLSLRMLLNTCKQLNAMLKERNFKRSSGNQLSRQKTWQERKLQWKEGIRCSSTVQCSWCSLLVYCIQCSSQGCS